MPVHKTEIIKKFANDTFEDEKSSSGQCTKGGWSDIKIEKHIMNCIEHIVTKFEEGDIVSCMLAKLFYTDFMLVITREF